VGKVAGVDEEYVNILIEDVKRRDVLKDRGIDGSMILKFAKKKHGVRV
jgi:hypothetical protein